MDGRASVAKNEAASLLALCISARRLYTRPADTLLPVRVVPHVFSPHISFQALFFQEVVDTIWHNQSMPLRAREFWQRCSVVSGCFALFPSAL